MVLLQPVQLQKQQQKTSSIACLGSYGYMMLLTVALCAFCFFKDFVLQSYIKVSIDEFHLKMLDSEALCYRPWLDRNDRTLPVARRQILQCPGDGAGTRPAAYRSGLRRSSFGQHCPAF